MIATGTQRRKLNVPGETEFIGKGVSYCRVCDGPFFKGLKVAVVGSTKDAITDASLLSEMAREVFLITQGEEISARSKYDDIDRKVQLYKSQLEQEKIKQKKTQI